MKKCSASFHPGYSSTEFLNSKLLPQALSAIAYLRGQAQEPTPRTKPSVGVAALTLPCHKISAVTTPQTRPSSMTSVSTTPQSWYYQSAWLRLLQPPSFYTATGDHDKLAPSCRALSQEGATLSGRYKISLYGKETSVYCNEGLFVWLYYTRINPNVSALECGQVNDQPVLYHCVSGNITRRSERDSEKKCQRLRMESI